MKTFLDTFLLSEVVDSVVSCSTFIKVIIIIIFYKVYTRKGKCVFLNRGTET